MNEQAIQEQYQHIVTLLKQQRLKEAQSQLEAFLWNSGDWTLRNRLEQAQTSYQYMLQYMRQGIDDPERQKLYRQILTETWEVADQARLSLLDGVSTHYYHSLRNNRERLPKEYNIAALQKVLESFPDDLAVCQLMPDNQGMDAVLQRHEQTAQVLFLSTWSNSDWSAEDEQQAKGLLESEMLPVNDLCLFTSAVMLSLMECFDTRKFSWLLDAVTHANTQVNQRALVGIAFALLFHPTRLSLYPELTARLSLLNEDGSFGKQLNRIYIELLRSQETEKIDKKMREEIIPEMMRNVNIMRNMKFGFEENPEENDLNPDWEKAFESSGLGDKIREMNELQLEGADVYMSTFAQLKTYPFFKEPYNWFYPFDMHHSSIIKEFGFKPTGDNAILSLILQFRFLLTGNCMIGFHLLNKNICIFQANRFCQNLCHCICQNFQFFDFYILSFCNFQAKLFRQPSDLGCDISNLSIRYLYQSSTNIEACCIKYISIFKQTDICCAAANIKIGNNFFCFP